MSLYVRNLSQYHGNRLIVDDISFDAPAGEIVALLGPNGAGKTTLLRSVVGLQRTTKKNKNSLKESSIKIDKVEISSWSVASRLQAGLIYVPQSTSLFLSLSVHDNLQLVYDYSDYWRERSSRDGKKKFEDECSFLLKKTELEKSIELPAGALSGGQKRKLEIIRALLLHPSVLMFDEPFAGVDPKSIYELKELFRELASQGMALVISDHHVDQLISLAKMFYVVVAGKIVVAGDIKAIMENEYTKTMYLGHEFHSEIFKRYLK